MSRLSIRTKLWILVVLLLITVGLLAASGFQGVYAYRALAKGVSHRASELPLAGRLSQRIGDLRTVFERARYVHHLGGTLGQQPVESELLREEFLSHLAPVTQALDSYRARVALNDEFDETIGDNEQELQAVATIDGHLNDIGRLARQEDWLHDHAASEQLGMRLETIAAQAAELPRHLQERMHSFATDVRGQYRTWIAMAWAGLVLGLGIMIALGALFYYWVFRPLRILIKGSQRVAAGDFDVRIRLDTRDEMAELAEAVNEMTAFFQVRNEELNEQVRERTKQVVRSEQLASVGFLAAGVSHEINNPLAAIAWAAESLEGRLDEILRPGDLAEDADHQGEIVLLREYLRRIQDEAYRCKGITEKLLDFSRLGDVELQDIDLRPLVQDVIDMVRHVGKYRDKRIEFAPGPAVIVPANAAEMKQVALNLITNALDSLDEGGQVDVTLADDGRGAELTVADNGCGMTEEVRENLFEPFFTRRRDGSGTGLGLSITYRIVAEHGGRIKAESDGPGHGSQFRVWLPLSHVEGFHVRQAA